jgi:hypothetical protein
VIGYGRLYSSSHAWLVLPTYLPFSKLSLLSGGTHSSHRLGHVPVVSCGQIAPSLARSLSLLRSSSLIHLSPSPPLAPQLNSQAGPQSFPNPPFLPHQRLQHLLTHSLTYLLYFSPNSSTHFTASIVSGVMVVRALGAGHLQLTAPLLQAADHCDRVHRISSTKLRWVALSLSRARARWVFGTCPA